MGRRITAIRAGAALVAAGCCLAAVAYAADGPIAGQSGGAPSATVSLEAKTPAPRRRPLPPRLLRHPEEISTSADARFVFAGVRHPYPTPAKTVAKSTLRFRCQVDRGNPIWCSKQLILRHLEAGSHSFVVQAVNSRGIEGAPTRFRWKQVEPRRFSIEPDLSSVGPLYPGAGPSVVPLRVSNPNAAPIFITSLWVSVTADPPGCDAAANLELKPASASGAAPLQVAAHASVHLPSQRVSAPEIALRDLPVNQDACQGVRFPLAFGGAAHE